MAPFLLLNLLGCASPFEGTWLFMVDRQDKVTGDCADPDDTTRSTGTENAWVDIYGLDSGELVVFYGEALVGTAEGSELQASWEAVDADEDTESRQTIELEATLDGATMSGKITQTSSETSGEDTYECSQQLSFDAERNVSSPDSYPDN